MNRVYTIYAGVNGAGKSTFYKTNTDGKDDKSRVNSDEILRENDGDWRNIEDQALAMKEAIRRVNYYLNNGLSFNQETTLTGKSIINNIEKAKKLGYTINLYYVGLNSADIAIKRIRKRVNEGGHGIPEEDVRRRYDQSLENLTRVIPICDKVELFDNTHCFARVAVYKEGSPTLINNKCKWLNRVIALQQHMNVQNDVLKLER